MTPRTLRVLTALGIFTALAALVFIATAQAAYAATVPVGELWQSTVAQVVAAVVGAILSALLAWVFAMIAKKTGVEVDAFHREALHSAAMTGVNLALTRFGVRASAVTVDVKSQVVADAANWVIRSVPDALARLKVSPDKLGALVEAKLGAIMQADVTTATTVAPASRAG